MIFLSMLAAGLITIAGCASMGGTAVEDPDGRFSYAVDSELEPADAPSSGVYAYTYAEPALDVFVAAAPAPTEDAGLEAIFTKTGFDFNRFWDPGFSSMEEWRLVQYRIEDSKKWAAIAYQFRSNTLYGLIVSGGADSTAETLPMSIYKLIGSFQFSDAAGEVFLPSDFAELEQFVDETEAHHGGAISLAVVKDGEIAYSYSKGDRSPGIPADTDTAYHWGSVTKIITGVAVMQLVESGKVGLDDTLDSYFPEFKAGKRMTVRNLLSHSSGFPGGMNENYLIRYEGHEMPDMESVWAEYRTRAEDLVFEPGSTIFYNNYNFLPLGLIVERISGQDFVDYVQEHIFDPLGMEKSGYEYASLSGKTAEAVHFISVEEGSALDALFSSKGMDVEMLIREREGDRVYLNPFDILPCWGGAKGPAEDLVRFSRLFLEQGTVDGKQILEKKSVRQMLTMQKSTDRKPLGIGLSVFLGRQGREPYGEHAGGGPGIDALLRFYPKQNVAIAVMSNAGGYSPGRMLYYISNLVLE